MMNDFSYPCFISGLLERQTLHWRFMGANHPHGRRPLAKVVDIDLASYRSGGYSGAILHQRDRCDRAIGDHRLDSTATMNVWRRVHAQTVLNSSITSHNKIKYATKTSGAAKSSQNLSPLPCQNNKKLQPRLLITWQQSSTSLKQPCNDQRVAEFAARWS